MGSMRAWFGEPWPGYICYDEDGRLIEEWRVPFPGGQACLFCTEVFHPGDSGEVTTAVTADGTAREAYVHKECMLRNVAGSVAHLEGRCICRGGRPGSEPVRTLREDALATWAWIQARGQADSRP